MAPAVLEVVLGNVNNSVANLEELRQKMEEDALKCGRQVRIVGHVENQNQSTSSLRGASNENLGPKLSMARGTFSDFVEASHVLSAGALFQGKFVQFSKL